MSDSYKIIKDVPSLSEALKERRKSLGVNQEELAEMNDISRFTIVNAESGSGDPRISTLLTIMNGLGMRLIAVPTNLADRVSLNENDESLSGDDWELNHE